MKHVFVSVVAEEGACPLPPDSLLQQTHGVALSVCLRDDQSSRRLAGIEVMLFSYSYMRCCDWELINIDLRRCAFSVLV